MNLSENQFSQRREREDLNKTHYVPNALTMPTRKDFTEVLEGELLGRKILAITHGNHHYDGVLKDLYDHNGQLVLKIILSDQKTVYLNWSSVSSIRKK